MCSPLRLLLPLPPIHSYSLISYSAPCCTVTCEQREEACKRKDNSLRSTLSHQASPTGISHTCNTTHNADARVFSTGILPTTVMPVHPHCPFLLFADLGLLLKGCQVSFLP